MPSAGEITVDVRADNSGLKEDVKDANRVVSEIYDESEGREKKRSSLIKQIAASSGRDRKRLEKELTQLTQQENQKQIASARQAHVAKQALNNKELAGKLKLTEATKKGGLASRKVLDQNSTGLKRYIGLLKKAAASARALPQKLSIQSGSSGGGGGGAIGKAVSGASKVVSRAGVVGGAIAGTAALGVAAFQAAAKAAKLNKVLANVKKTTQATEAEMADLRVAVLEAAATTGGEQKDFLAFARSMSKLSPAPEIATNLRALAAVTKIQPDIDTRTFLTGATRLARASGSATGAVESLTTAALAYRDVSATPLDEASTEIGTVFSKIRTGYKDAEQGLKDSVTLAIAASSSGVESSEGTSVAEEIALKTVEISGGGEIRDKIQGILQASLNEGVEGLGTPAKEIKLDGLRIAEGDAAAVPEAMALAVNALGESLEEGNPNIIKFIEALEALGPAGVAIATEIGGTAGEGLQAFLNQAASSGESISRIAESLEKTRAEGTSAVLQLQTQYEKTADNIMASVARYRDEFGKLSDSALGGSLSMLDGLQSTQQVLAHFPLEVAKIQEEHDELSGLFQTLEEGTAGNAEAAAEAITDLTAQMAEARHVPEELKAVIDEVLQIDTADPRQQLAMLSRSFKDLFGTMEGFDEKQQKAFQDSTRALAAGANIDLDSVGAAGNARLKEAQDELLQNPSIDNAQNATEVRQEVETARTALDRIVTSYETLHLRKEKETLAPEAYAKLLGEHIQKILPGESSWLPWGSSDHEQDAAVASQLDERRKAEQEAAKKNFDNRIKAGKQVGPLRANPKTKPKTTAQKPGKSSKPKAKKTKSTQSASNKIKRERDQAAEKALRDEERRNNQREAAYQRAITRQNNYNDKLEKAKEQEIVSRSKQNRQLDDISFKKKTTDDQAVNITLAGATDLARQGPKGIAEIITDDFRRVGLDQAASNNEREFGIAQDNKYLLNEISANKEIVKAIHAVTLVSSKELSKNDKATIATATKANDLEQIPASLLTKAVTQAIILIDQKIKSKENEIDQTLENSKKDSGATEKTTALLVQNHEEEIASLKIRGDAVREAKNRIEDLQRQTSLVLAEGSVQGSEAIIQTTGLILDRAKTLKEEQTATQEAHDKLINSTSLEDLASNAEALPASLSELDNDIETVSGALKRIIGKEKNNRDLSARSLQKLSAAEGLTEQWSRQGPGRLSREIGAVLSPAHDDLRLAASAEKADPDAFQKIIQTQEARERLTQIEAKIKRILREQTEERTKDLELSEAAAVLLADGIKSGETLADANRKAIAADLAVLQNKKNLTEGESEHKRALLATQKRLNSEEQKGGEALLRSIQEGNKALSARQGLQEDAAQAALIQSGTDLADKGIGFAKSTVAAIETAGESDFAGGTAAFLDLGSEASMIVGQLLMKVPGLQTAGAIIVGAGILMKAASFIAGLFSGGENEAEKAARLSKERLADQERITQLSKEVYDLEVKGAALTKSNLNLAKHKLRLVEEEIRLRTRSTSSNNPYISRTPAQLVTDIRTLKQQEHITKTRRAREQKNIDDNFIDTDAEEARLASAIRAHTSAVIKLEQAKRALELKDQQATLGREIRQGTLDDLDRQHREQKIYNEAIAGSFGKRLDKSRIGGYPEEILRSHNEIIDTLNGFIEKAALQGSTRPTTTQKNMDDLIKKITALRHNSGTIGLPRIQDAMWVIHGYLESQRTTSDGITKKVKDLLIAGISPLKEQLVINIAPNPRGNPNSYANQHQLQRRPDGYYRTRYTPTIPAIQSLTERAIREHVADTPYARGKETRLTHNYETIQGLLNSDHPHQGDSLTRTRVDLQLPNRTSKGDLQELSLLQDKIKFISHHLRNPQIRASERDHQDLSSKLIEAINDRETKLREMADSKIRRSLSVIRPTQGLPRDMGVLRKTLAVSPELMKRVAAAKHRRIRYNQVLGVLNASGPSAASTSQELYDELSKESEQTRLLMHQSTVKEEISKREAMTSREKTSILSSDVTAGLKEEFILINDIVKATEKKESIASYIALHGDDVTQEINLEHARAEAGLASLIERQKEQKKAFAERARQARGAYLSSEAETRELDILSDALRAQTAATRQLSEAKIQLLHLNAQNKEVNRGRSRATRAEKNEARANESRQEALVASLEKAKDAAVQAQAEAKMQLKLLSLQSLHAEAALNGLTDSAFSQAKNQRSNQIALMARQIRLQTKLNALGTASQDPLAAARRAHELDQLRIKIEIQKKVTARTDLAEQQASRLVDAEIATFTEIKRLRTTNADQSKIKEQQDLWALAQLQNKALSASELLSLLISQNAEEMQIKNTRAELLRLEEAITKEREAQADQGREENQYSKKAMDYLLQRQRLLLAEAQTDQNGVTTARPIRASTQAQLDAIAINLRTELNDNHNMSTRDIALALNGFNNIPQYEKGTSSVPRTSVALVHINERIVPAGLNQDLTEFLEQQQRAKIIIHEHNAMTNHQTTKNYKQSINISKSITDKQTSTEKRRERHDMAKLIKSMHK